MAILSSIRRWHLRDSMPIREIVRRTGLSRNTIRKYLANKVVEPKYPDRKTPSKLDDYATKLTAWLQPHAWRVRQYDAFQYDQFGVKFRYANSAEQ